MSKITHMLTFAEVVEHGSFTRAAQALGLSQPMVSRQVSQLEGELGVQLLNRSTRRLHLTEAGEVFYDYCQRIAREALAAEAAVTPLQAQAQGVLRITAPQCLTSSLLSRAINDFQQQHPGVEVELKISARTVDLIDEGIDLALRLGDLRDSNLIARQISPATFVPCASTTYWERHGIPDHPQELKAHQCLVYSEKPNPYHWEFREQEQSLKVTVASRCRSDDAGVLLNMLYDHCGVMYAPSFLFHRGIQQGVLQSVLHDFLPNSVGLYLVYPHARHLPPKTRAFIDFLFSEQASAYVRELSFNP